MRCLLFLTLLLKCCIFYYYLSTAAAGLLLPLQTLSWAGEDFFFFEDQAPCATVSTPNPWGGYRTTATRDEIRLRFSLRSRELRCRHYLIGMPS